MKTSHPETDPADEYMMIWFDAVVEFQRAVVQSRCGYTPGCIANWWLSGERHRIEKFQNLERACAKLEEIIGPDDPYWTHSREEHSDL